MVVQVLAKLNLATIVIHLQENLYAHNVEIVLLIQDKVVMMVIWWQEMDVVQIVWYKQIINVQVNHQHVFLLHSVEMDKFNQLNLKNVMIIIQLMEMDVIQIV